MQQYQAQANELAGKVILVTGATDGIGLSAAKTYAQYGATVILLGRNIKKLEKVYDDIVELGYAQPIIYPMDLMKASPDHYEELHDNIKKEFGRLDGLLHNAANLGALAPIEQYDIKQWYLVMQTNLNAPFLLTKAVLPLLKAAPKANVIFTSADVGQQCRAYWGAYGVSKYAIEGLMQTLNDELSETNVRVNCINPGVARTRLHAKAYPGIKPETVPHPDSLMPGYLYLMSDEVRERGESVSLAS